MTGNHLFPDWEHKVFSLQNVKKLEGKTSKKFRKYFRTVPKEIERGTLWYRPVL